MERFRIARIRATWGSGGLTVEFDALSQLSVPTEPDTLIEISVLIFGRLAPQISRAFLFLKSQQMSIAEFAELGREPCGRVGLLD